MRTHRYPGDVTDGRWALTGPRIPLHPGGRPRRADVRDVLDPILHILRTGCRWRCSDERRHDGTPDVARDSPRRRARAAERPYHPRAAAGVDGQSVAATSGGEAGGGDNRKDVGGRRRRAASDGVGSPPAVLVTAASVDDGVAAEGSFARLDGRPIGRVRRVFADSKHRGIALHEWVGSSADCEMAIIGRPEGVKGRVEPPTRRAVGRTFARPGRCRRSSQEREKSVRPSEAFVKPAMIRLMLHRLDPPGSDAESCCGMAAWYYIWDRL